MLRSHIWHKWFYGILFMGISPLNLWKVRNIITFAQQAWHKWTVHRFFVSLTSSVENSLCFCVKCMKVRCCHSSNPLLMPQVICTLATSFYFHPADLIFGHLALFKKEWCCVFKRLAFHFFSWYESNGFLREAFRKTIIFCVLYGIKNTSRWCMFHYSIDQGCNSFIGQLPVLRFPWVKLVL